MSRICCIAEATKKQAGRNKQYKKKYSLLLRCWMAGTLDFKLIRRRWMIITTKKAKIGRPQSKEKKLKFTHARTQNSQLDYLVVAAVLLVEWNSTNTWGHAHRSYPNMPCSNAMRLGIWILQSQQTKLTDFFLERKKYYGTVQQGTYSSLGLDCFVDCINGTK